MIQPPLKGEEKEKRHEVDPNSLYSCARWSRFLDLQNSHLDAQNNLRWKAGVWHHESRWNIFLFLDYGYSKPYCDISLRRSSKAALTKDLVHVPPSADFWQRGLFFYKNLLFLFPMKALMHFFELLVGDMGINLRGGDGRMPQHRLDAPDVRAVY